MNFYFTSEIRDCLDLFSNEQFTNGSVCIGNTAGLAVPHCGSAKNEKQWRQTACSYRAELISKPAASAAVSF